MQDICCDAIASDAYVLSSNKTVRQHITVRVRRLSYCSVQLRQVPFSGLMASEIDLIFQLTIKYGTYCRIVSEPVRDVAGLKQRLNRSYALLSTVLY